FREQIGYGALNQVLELEGFPNSSVTARAGRRGARLPFADQADQEIMRPILFDVIIGLVNDAQLGASKEPARSHQRIQTVDDATDIAPPQGRKNGCSLDAD